MAFVQDETWNFERRQVPFGIGGRLLEVRWQRDGFAAIVSLSIVAGLIAALISLGRLDRSERPIRNDAIVSLDMTPVTGLPSGSHNKETPEPNTIPPVSIDTTSVALPSPEWSVSVLPPSQSSVQAPASPAVVPAPSTPGIGTSAQGNGAGAGYDPYAFASYHKPQSPSPLAGTAPVQPLPDALARLSAAFLAGKSRSGRTIALRAYVDAAGRVVRIEPVSASDQDLVRQVAQVLPGLVLCPPDGTRSAEAMLTVTVMI